MLRTEVFLEIETGIDGVCVFRCHGPKRILDDGRGVGTDADLPLEHMPSGVMGEEIPVICRCGMPPLILHKGIIGAQIHGNRPAAGGATNL